MSRPTFSLQPLEARRFLSATPPHVEDCPEVVEAREDLQEVTMDLRHDRYAGRQALGAIRAEIVEELRRMHEENGEELREAVAPLRQELVAAIRALGAARHEILQDLQAIREKWQPTIQADLAAIRDARAGGDEDAAQEATDKFHADRNALYAELNPLKERLLEVTKEKGAAITDARLAIEDKLAEFSPALESLLAQLRTKAREVEAKLIAGHDKVMAAREELRVAIENCREEHGDEHAVA